MGFASVRALVAGRNEMIRDILESFFELRIGIKRLGKFLDLKIVKKEKPKLSLYKKKSETRRKERVMEDGKITPEWQVFAAPNDRQRTPEEHARIVAIKAKMFEDNQESYIPSTDKPDPVGIIALNNIISTLNPKVERLEIETDIFHRPKKYKTNYRRAR